MHRSLAIIILAVSLSIAAPVKAAMPSDIEGTLYETAILDLQSRGVVQGYSDGTFRPDAAINRAELLQILLRSRFSTLRDPADLRCFQDLEVKMPQWYARPVCLGAELGIVSGYPDGTFRPERTVLLVEALKMAMRTFSVAVDPVGGGAWYEPYLAAARSRGILMALLRHPDHLLTRGEMASITMNLLRETENTSMNPALTPVCGNGVREGAEQCDDGNVQDSDGCSSICIIVPEPVRLAFLQIEERASGTLSTMAKGQRGIALLKFTAVAGRQDVLLTSLTFGPSIGSLAYGQRYSLAMDRNGDGAYETIVQDIGKVDGASLTFDTLQGGGVLLPKGLIVPFIVTADLSSSLGPVSLGLEFASSLPDYIEAQGATDHLALTGIETDQVCTASDCFIRVDMTASSDITVLERGNLFVTEDSAPVRSRILLGGSISDALLKLRMRSNGEDIDLRTIRIDGVVSDIESLLLYRVTPGSAFDPAQLEPFARATNGQCPDQIATRFCAHLSIGTFLVHPEQETTLVVAATLKNSSMGAVSGQQMTLTLSSSISPSDAALEAVGVSSNQSLVQNDGDGQEDGEIFIGISAPGTNSPVSGKVNDIALATIGSVSNAGTREEPYIPAGQAVIGSFAITSLPHTNTAQGRNDVTVRSIFFTVNAQNVQLDPMGFTLRTKEDPGVSIGCSGAATTGSFAVTCTGIDGGKIRSLIDQGHAVHYELLGNITNPQMAQGSSSLFVSIPSLGQRGGPSSILWSDGSTSFSWVDTDVIGVDGTVYRTR